MSDRKSYQRQGFAEALAPYGAERSSGPHTKLSISLPSDLAELLRGAASERGMTVSALIGAALRRTLEEADQARLDRALELDADENLAWANAYLPIAAKLMSDIEW